MILPEETDSEDAALLASMLPTDSMVHGYVVAVSFSDGDGNPHWKVFANCDMSVTSTLGLLELAKLDVIARSDTGLPIRHEDS